MMKKNIFWIIAAVTGWLGLVVVTTITVIPNSPVCSSSPVTFYKPEWPGIGEDPDSFKIPLNPKYATPNIKRIGNNEVDMPVADTGSAILFGAFRDFVPYPHSVNPGESGKYIITAFTGCDDCRLRDASVVTGIQPGDEIEIEYYSDKKNYIYVVTDAKIVNYSKTELLEGSTDTSKFLLITWYRGLQTNQRFVIEADLDRAIDY